MSTALPTVVEALLTLAASLESVLVLDSYGNTSDPGDYIMIGVDDPNNLESARGGHAESDWRHVGHQTRREEGYVVCAALSWNGDGDVRAARNGAFAITALLEDAIKADPTIGGSVLFASTSSHDYLPNVSDTGAECIVVFTVNYVAQI